MFRYLATFSILFGVHGLIAQSDTLNQRDENDKKHGYWITYGADRPTSGYPSDGKIEEGPFVDNRKEGLWTKYWEDGITPKLIGNYKNNRPNGAYWKFYRNGNLKEHGGFSRGHYIGPLHKYDEEGRLLLNAKYDNSGKMIDTSFIYFATGCLEAIEIMDVEGAQVRSIVYREDSCNQVLKITDHQTSRTGRISHPPRPQNDSTGFIYQVNPRIEKEGTWRYQDEFLIPYSDSSLNSNSTYVKKYNQENEIIFTGTCKDGKVWEGKMYFYDSDGILLRVEVWKEGEYLKVGRL